MAQVVDTESAKEFMREALDKIAPEELQKICSEVERKSQWFQQKLSRDAIGQLSPAEYLTLLRHVFSTRRKAESILEQFRLESWRNWTWNLLYGEREVGVRFQNFLDHLEGVEANVRQDFASEILHFSDPERYWLWTRWMWDPKTQTGALPLVTYEACDMNGPTAGDIYMRVGEAVAFVHQVGEAAGFQTISKDMFGTDVFLACVYVVYVYTVLRMRMTQEFNKVMPGLSEFVRRLLGVYEKTAA
ncbi:MAG: hypothetical protein HY644_12065 [Acidobacteria bacterium]|nr:hypothetical protein [Acidobacteriota bacterium]